MTDLLGPNLGTTPAFSESGRATPPTRRRRLLRVGLFAAVAVVAVLLLSIMASSPSTSTIPLDPDSPSRAGMRAVAEVLRQHDVDVEVVRGVDALEDTTVDASTTVVISDPDYLGPGAAERTTAHIAEARRFVILHPSDLVLSDLGLPLTEAGPITGTTTHQAGCSTDVADPGDELVGQADAYLPDADATVSSTVRCFASGESANASGARRAALVVVAAGPDSPEAVVLGSATAFANAWVTDGSHAALAMRTLGSSPRLVWYVPVVTDLSAPGLSGDQPDPDRGVPDWFAPAVLLLGITFVAFAFVRGRRLGRAVTEPLPVVVRAIETTEARGRLYRRAADCERAAAALRQGTQARLAARVGLPAQASAQTLVDLVARLTGQNPSDLHDLLTGRTPANHTGRTPANHTGRTPANDQDLLLLAQQLADLEESVRRA